MSNKLDVTGKWYGVLSSLGIDRNYLQNKHGPCPICMEGTDRFRFDDKDARGKPTTTHPPCVAGVVDFGAAQNQAVNEPPIEEGHAGLHR